MAKQSGQDFYDLAAVWLFDNGPYLLEQERWQWLSLLRSHIQELHQVGWSLLAIKDGYLSLLEKDCEMDMLEDVFHQAQIFGNPIFLSLFNQQVRQIQTVSQAQKT
ncbi:hypothetical protein D3X11_03895 [Streptococcus sp. X16XC17]|uniref:hypothetical protein n=1 Tax=unclassified Streptococcus TaxID=2608887 RepID=UPI00066FE0F4|nr:MULTISPECIES: hypothetical protein [unclassified Streptococcus]TCD46541.1 hypothetical protein D3X11_03895 [Streptococcus sp. X16XC17]